MIFGKTSNGHQVLLVLIFGLFGLVHISAMGEESAAKKKPPITYPPQSVSGYSITTPGLTTKIDKAGDLTTTTTTTTPPYGTTSTSKSTTVNPSGDIKSEAFLVSTVESYSGLGVPGVQLVPTNTYTYQTSIDYVTSKADFMAAQKGNVLSPEGGQSGSGSLPLATVTKTKGWNFAIDANILSIDMGGVSKGASVEVKQTVTSDGKKVGAAETTKTNQYSTSVSSIVTSETVGADNVPTSTTKTEYGNSKVGPAASSTMNCSDKKCVTTQTDATMRDAHSFDALGMSLSVNAELGAKRACPTEGGCEKFDAVLSRKVDALAERYQQDGDNMFLGLNHISQPVEVLSEGYSFGLSLKQEIPGTPYKQDIFGASLYETENNIFSADEAALNAFEAKKKSMFNPLLTNEQKRRFQEIRRKNDVGAALSKAIRLREEENLAKKNIEKQGSIPPSEDSRWLMEVISVGVSSYVSGRLQSAYPVSTQGAKYAGDGGKTANGGSGACKSGSDKLTREFDGIKARKPAGTGQVDDLQFAMYMTQKLIDQLSKDCAGEPGISETLASLRSSYSDTERICSQVKNGICVPKANW